MKMLTYLHRQSRYTLQTHFRKLQLFACACSRHVWPGHKDKLPIVEAWERYKDGCPMDAGEVRQAAFCLPFDPAVWECWDGDDQAQRAAQVRFLRCIFGNPFCPVTGDPGWRTSAVLMLARAVYEERACAWMPILADALEEAGCAAQALLDHLREPGLHVRGCWPVDLVLGRE